MVISPSAVSFRGSGRLLRVVVDRQHLARDRLAGIRSKEDGQSRNIARIDKSLEGLNGHGGLLLLVDRSTAQFRPAFEGLFYAGSDDGAGQDRIRANAERT